MIGGVGRLGAQVRSGLQATLMLLPALSAVAVNAPPRGEQSPAVSIPRVREPPVVDGSLDDGAWRGAAHFGAFRTLRPDPGRPPSLETEVLLAADREILYVGIRCQDNRADGLRDRARDEGDLLDDDWVLFALDTYGDGLAAYFFAVNPAGTRADGTLNWEGRPDLGLDLEWSSGVRRSGEGYTAEFAIPFRALSHPASGRGAAMAFKVARYISRLAEEVDFPELRTDGGPPLTQFQAIALSAVAPSVVPPSTLIAKPTGAAGTDGRFDLNTLEGRSQAWGEVEVSDYLLFPHEDIANRGEPLLFPVRDESTAVARAFEPLEYRPGRSVGDLEAFLTRTATAGFIVIAGDTVVYERYFNGYGRDSLMTSFSVAKSFVSTMVGVAIAEGRIGSVRDPITRYIPELAARDPRFSDIAVEQLLAMSSGLRYDDAPPHWDDAVTYYHPRLRDAALGEASIERRPGERFLYNNYNPLLVGIVLERVTGMSVPRYLERVVWTPLGMEYPGSWSLDSDSSRFAKMESGINARAIDYAKLGQLYLHRGLWRGRQILSTDWVTAATQPTACPAGYYPGWPLFDADGGYYGYYWWGRRRGDGPHDFFAQGNKGQFIYVSPQAQLVIVRTGIEFGVPSRTWIDLFYEFATRWRTGR